MTEAELFFGRDRTGVSAAADKDWQRFLAEDVTPRFPDGLTAEDASGQRKNAKGAIIREASKHLIIVFPAHPMTWQTCPRSVGLISNVSSGSVTILEHVAAVPFERGRVILRWVVRCSKTRIDGVNVGFSSLPLNPHYGRFSFVFSVRTT